MTDTKFTPGPWKWWTSNSWKRLRRDDGRKEPTVLEPYVCSDGHPDLMVHTADAHLIATSPDLYEALQYLVDESNPDMDEDYNPHAAPLNRARTALAKARGESQ